MLVVARRVDEVIATRAMAEESGMAAITLVTFLPDCWVESWMPQLAAAAVARHLTIESSGGIAIGVGPVSLQPELGRNLPRTAG
jgi:hypothetical protein